MESTNREIGLREAVVPSAAHACEERRRGGVDSSDCYKQQQNGVVALTAKNVSSVPLVHASSTPYSDYDSL